MVRVAGAGGAVRSMKASILRTGLLLGGTVLFLSVFYTSCVGRVNTNEFGVVQRKFGFKVGIVDKVYDPGLYFLGPGTTMHVFPREIQVLEASAERQESIAKARARNLNPGAVEDYYKERDKVLGSETHRVIEAFNIQTSDGYSVTADVTLLFSISNPVQVAKEFGWGFLYLEGFVINTFRNGVLTTMGKMNAESFYNEEVRIAAVKEAEELLRKRFSERGFSVEKLLIRNYMYVADYERSLHDKKVAVQLTEKNRKESLVNEEKAKLRQIEFKGNATITIAESEVNAQISKIVAEAQLYSSQTRARGDLEINIAAAEAKKLKANALTETGGKYVVALEIAKMFDNIDGAVMTPEQYIAFIRNAWSIIGVNPGGAVPSAAGREK